MHARVRAWGGRQAEGIFSPELYDLDFAELLHSSTCWSADT